MSRDRAGVIIVDNNHVLLMHRKKGNANYYCIPGGHIEAGESAQEAAIREIKEETTLDVTVADTFLEVENQGRKETYFFAKSFSGTVQLSGEELDRHSEKDQFDLQWIPIKTLSSILIYPEEIGKKLEYIITQSL